jgi:hypothetical protein
VIACVACVLSSALEPRHTSLPLSHAEILYVGAGCLHGALEVAERGRHREAMDCDCSAGCVCGRGAASIRRCAPASCGWGRYCEGSNVLCMEALWSYSDSQAARRPGGRWGRRADMGQDGHGAVVERLGRARGGRRAPEGAIGVTLDTLGGGRARCGAAD